MSRTNRVPVSCTQCGASIERIPSQIKGNTFCSRSCAATYNNSHKTYGTNRSKLEVFLEEYLRTNYPHVELVCNTREVIGAELDFYFPDHKLAIELNGIVHYEPIYGTDRLHRIANNDKQKMIRCLEIGVELAVVDISRIKHLTPAHKAQTAGIITQILVDAHVV